jgi:hypothetical protein
MFMGPGEFGEFDNLLYSKKVNEKLITNNKKNQIRSFVNVPKQGDLVLLRKGYQVVSLGTIPEEGYHWDERFDDIYGWDLQHSRRVVWQHEISEELKHLQKSKPLFGDRIQTPTFSRVEDPKIIQPIKHLLDALKPRKLRNLDDLKIPGPMSMETFGEELFARGIPNESVDKVINAIQRQRRLGKWYLQTEHGIHRPTEHEVVAHMVLPLLLALGWSEQLLAIEWKKVDLAGFKGTPTTCCQCVFICEVKRLGDPLQTAYDQASSYIEKLNLTQCRKILLTDGLRIYVYDKQDDSWPETPSGYFNVTMIRSDHIAPKNTNAVDTLVGLTPAGMVSG